MARHQSGRHSVTRCRADDVIFESPHSYVSTLPFSFGPLPGRRQKLTISPHPKRKEFWYLEANPVLRFIVPERIQRKAWLPRCAGCGSLRLRDSAQQPDRITVRVLSLFAFRYPYCVFPEVGWPVDGP